MDKETFERAKKLFSEKEKIEECIDFLNNYQKRLRLADEDNHDGHIVIVDLRLIAMFRDTACARCREINKEIDNL